MYQNNIEYRISSRDTSKVDDIIPNDLLREHLILEDDDSTLLNMYKNAAIDAAEKFMNRAVLPSVIELSTYQSTFRLPYGGTSIASVTDDDGNAVTYKMNPVTKIVTITGNVTFPVIMMVNCSFEPIPPSIVHGLCMYVASAYQNRESTVLGISATEISLNHQAIFQQHRLPNSVGGLRE
ncbi:head-tail connector protein [Aeromonas caviae]